MSFDAVKHLFGNFSEVAVLAIDRNVLERKGEKRNFCILHLSYLDNNKHERYKTAHAYLNPLSFGVTAHSSIFLLRIRTA